MSSISNKCSPFLSKEHLRNHHCPRYHLTVIDAVFQLHRNLKRGLERITVVLSRCHTAKYHVFCGVSAMGLRIREGGGGDRVEGVLPPFVILIFCFLYYSLNEIF